MLSIGALMVTAGRLADIFGRRRVIVIGLAIFGIVSFVCGMRAGRVVPDRRARRARHRRGADLPGVDRRRVEHVLGRAPGARHRRRARLRRRSARRWDPSSAARSPSTSTGAACSSSTFRSASRRSISCCATSRNRATRRPTATSTFPGCSTITGGLVCISLAFDRGEAWGWTSLADARHAGRRRRAAGAVRGDRGARALAARRRSPSSATARSTRWCSRDRCPTSSSASSRCSRRCTCSRRAACRRSTPGSCSSRCPPARGRRATSRAGSPRGFRPIA